jgi:16S rRNA (adenine1518-N6/adenine1519-N6)-dimethyltransferase
MQKLGQHFLKNAEVLEKSVSALALADGDRVVEIGPGHGELTAPLALAARGKHCAITCIEKDHALIEGLTMLAAKENSAIVTIIEGDALKLLPKIPATKIVGNIPYYITGKLLRVISELDQKPKRVALLIQKEVAERICAAPPEMNRLAASVQFWANATIIEHVPRKDFSPPPEVDSAVILLENKDFSPTATLDKATTIDPALYYRAVRGIFAQPRKTLLNNLSAVAKDGTSKTEIIAHLEKIGIDPAARPQDLGIDQIIAIARADFLD